MLSDWKSSGRFLVPRPLKSIRRSLYYADSMLNTPAAWWRTANRGWWRERRDVWACPWPAACLSLPLDPWRSFVERLCLELVNLYSFCCLGGWLNNLQIVGRLAGWCHLLVGSLYVLADFLYNFGQFTCMSCGLNDEWHSNSKCIFFHRCVGGSNCLLVYSNLIKK